MTQAYQEKDDHPAVEGPGLPIGIGDLYAEPHTEEQGEKGIELSVYEESLYCPSHLVGDCPTRRIGKGP